MSDNDPDRGFTMSLEEGGEPPANWDNFDGTTWTVTLTRNGHTYRTEFHQGSAHTEAPTLHDVLSCVLADMAGSVDSTFEDWAPEYGYDIDSRNAERIFNAVQRQNVGMAPLVGNDDLYELHRHFDD